MDIFGIGPMELLVILAVALVVFGPGKLPEIANTVGKAVREFRATTGDLTSEFQRSFNDLSGTNQATGPDGQQNATTAQTRADQAPTSASSPASPIPAAPAMAYSPAVPRRMPTKEDPLADLMPIDVAPSVPTNGHVDGGSERVGRTLI